MTLEALQQLCNSYTGVTESVKWDDHLCFCVGDKMFLVTSLSQNPTSASFKASDEDFETLSVREGCKPAAYLARYKWVYTEDIRHFSKKEWETYARQAYELIAAKLPAKLKKQLGITL